MNALHVAFATYQGQPEITLDDALASRELEALGIEVTSVPWSDAAAEWGGFDGVVLRSCWDYFHNPSEFLAWITRLENLPVRVWNSPAIVRWNHEKTYLADLRRSGVNIVPSIFAPMGTQVSIERVIAEQRWDRAAIKPTISGTSLHTWVASREGFVRDQVRLDTLLRSRSMMLQEYLPQIELEGEWSLIFICGNYSHAVRKVPKHGDFRVQKDFGGISIPEVPSAEVLRQAHEVVRIADLELLYARVDGVVDKGKFLLMELEVIEPVLFFAAAPESGKLFAQGIVDLLQEQRATLG